MVGQRVDAPLNTKARAEGPVNDSFELISRAACRIFRERGYHATSMRAISSAMGMQPAALYYWYPSKEELLFSIMEAAIDGLTLRVREAINPSAPAAERLCQAIGAHITTIADHLDELSVFLHELKSLNAKRREHIQGKSIRYERIFRDILQDGMNAGEFRGLDPRLAEFMILAGCNWLYNWYKPGGPYQPEEIAGAFSDIILNGLLP